MNEQQQNIAIAESRGWKGIAINPDDGWVCGYEPEPNIIKKRVPSYTSDLNAMHEVEKTTRMKIRYIDFLGKVCGLPESENHIYDAMVYTVFATAAQRAEAYLRTIGKWEGATS